MINLSARAWGRLFLSLLLGWLLCFSYGSPAQGQEEVLDRVRDLLEGGKVQEAVSLSGQAVKDHPDQAEAWRLLGEAWTALASSEPTEYGGRRMAREAFKRALDLDYNDPATHVALARLLLKAQEPDAAERHLRFALGRDPGNAEAHYWLGWLRTSDYLKYRGMVSAHGRINYRSRAAEDLELARAAYRRALSSPDWEGRAWEGLTRLAALAGENAAVLAQAESLAAHAAEVPEPHLYRGLALHRLGREDKAMEAFQQAFRAMHDTLRAVFTRSTVDLLIPDSLKVRYDTSPEEVRDGIWRIHDPLYLTRVSERELEHYVRVVYANLRWSDPVRSIPGWQTEPGQVYIRYGPPHQVVRNRPLATFGAEGIRLTPTGRDHYEDRLESSSAQEAREALSLLAEDEAVVTLGGSLGTRGVLSSTGWAYPDFWLAFVDPYGTGGFELGDDSRAVMETMAKRDPSHFSYDFRRPVFTLPTLLTRFKGREGGASILLFYGFPRDSLVAADGESRPLHQGFFIFDGGLEEVHREVWSSRVPIGKGLAVRGGLLIDRFERELSPGRYLVGVEASAEPSGPLGHYRRWIDLPSFADTLAVSDILLARSVDLSPIEDGQERAGFRVGPAVVHPNVAADFRAAEPLWLYYEVYGLQTSGEGRHRYRLEYTVRAETELPVPLAILRSVGQALGVVQAPGQTTVRFELSAKPNLPDRQVETLAIDLSQLRPGRYELALAIEDLVGGGTAQSSTKFTISP